MLEFHFNKVAGLHFPVNITKFLRTVFSNEHLRWLFLLFLTINSHKLISWTILSFKYFLKNKPKFATSPITHSTTMKRCPEKCPTENYPPEIKPQENWPQENCFTRSLLLLTLSYNSSFQTFYSI